MVIDSFYIVNSAFVSKIDRLNNNFKQNILLEVG